MAKKSSWFSAVKKAISPASKENRNKNNWKRLGCLRRQKSIGLKKAPPTEENKLLEAQSEQNRHAYSVALVTAMAAEAAVAAANAAAEVVYLRATAYTSDKTKEEIASIKIQTAFRGYMARRLLRALRGLVRLKSAVGGKSVTRQVAESLKCMQTVARLQFEIRARRLRNIKGMILQKQDNEVEKLRHSNREDWDESTQSREQIVAEISNRQEGAMRRERALAYAYSHQSERNTSGSTNKMFVDSNNRGLGWSWLERWMAARPWEKENEAEDLTRNDHVTAKTATGRDFQSPATSRQSPSTPKSRRAGGKIRPPSPRGALGRDDDSKSLKSTQSMQCRRRSIAGSSVRDDDSLASAPAVPGYMAYTKSARAKSRLPSPQGSETFGSIKKRLSFPLN